MELRHNVITEKTQLNGDTYRFVIAEGGSAFNSPGQLIRVHSLKGNGKKLIPVVEFDSNRYIIVFRADDEVGKELAALESGDNFAAELGIGNGFDIDAIPDECVIAGEGIGIATMLGVLRRILMLGKESKVVLCYESVEEMFLLREFIKLTATLDILTIDGSNGRQGHIDSAIFGEDYVCAWADDEVLENAAHKVKRGQFASLMHFDGEGPVYDKTAFEQ